ncbi:MAG: NAD(+)/NADH kinase [Sphaerochaetaceae bacterium]|nr:NAD(+)/NADH kinase [Sphaerochaetaceae bacterium]
MELKKVAVFANPGRMNVLSVYSSIRDFLSERNIETELVSLVSGTADSLIGSPDCDLAISLGGDGTVLTCAWIMRGTNVPLLAVNMGHFGYITDTGTDEINYVLQDIIEGREIIEDRMRVEVNVFRNGKLEFSDSALNEITVSTLSHAKTAKLNLYINDVFAASLKADGVVFATPTGSTAYSLSTGGPILDANINAIIISPISPFTISARPLVVNKNSRINVDLPPQNAEIEVISDGHGIHKVHPGDRIVITRSDYVTRFVRNKARNSIEILREKLGWAGGFNA